jgi:hypothetical protein
MIAIQKGAINNTNKSILGFFPDTTFTNVEDRLE